MHQETERGLEAAGKGPRGPRGHGLERMSFCRPLEHWGQPGHKGQHLTNTLTSQMGKLRLQG